MCYKYNPITMENDMNKIEQHIAGIINRHTVHVDSRIIKMLDREFDKKTYSNRENVDALLLELTLKSGSKIKTLDKVPGEEYQWRHDWAEDWTAFSPETPIYLIDLKRRPAKYPNIVLSGTDKMIKSYNMGQLTHIVAFSQSKETNYQLGDWITFKFEGILPVKEAIKMSTQKTSEYSLLHKSCLQTEEYVV